MKSSTRISLIGLVALCTVGLFIAGAQAGAQFDGGGVVNGLSIQGDAPGTKLTGTVVIEAQGFRGCDSSAADLRVILRLNNGNDFYTFFAPITCATSGAATACTVRPKTACNNGPLPTYPIDSSTRINLNGEPAAVVGVQQAIIAVLGPDIRSSFGFGSTANLVLRTADQFERIPGVDMTERIYVGLVQLAIK